MKLICFITQIERFHFLFGGLFFWGWGGGGVVAGEKERGKSQLIGGADWR